MIDVFQIAGLSSRFPHNLRNTTKVSVLYFFYRIRTKVLGASTVLVGCTGMYCTGFYCTGL